MSKIKSKLSEKRITILRRIVQLTAFTFFNYIIIEAIFSVNLRGLEPFVKVQPFLSSPRNPLSNGGGLVEYMFFFLADGKFPFLIIGILMIIFLLSGRFFCGWFCPVGAIQDCLAAFPTKKKRIKMDTHKTLLKTKFLILVLLLLIIVPLGVAKIIDPAFYDDYRDNLEDWADKPVGFFSLSEFLFVFLPQIMVKIFENWEQDMLMPIFSDFWVCVFFFFYMIVIILAIYYPRFYCRYLCPFGAIASSVSDYSLLKLSRSPVKCAGRAQCGKCEDVCPIQVRILDEPFEFFTGNGECNLCMACKESCPNKAIKLKFG